MANRNRKRRYSDNSYKVAAYLRLSREDGDKKESDSIESQRKIISQFCFNNNLDVYEEYIDDGFTGTNFNRPSFKRMIDDIEMGNIGCVIVKDLSRFGRDYIDTGKYLERYFPKKNVRFIAVNDNIDSFEGEYDLLMPVKNIFNEQYARDISKKVQSAFKAKQKNGEFVGAFPSYGYLKSATDKHKLVIDEYAASVVNKIFKMYSEGQGKVAIAKILNSEGVLCPSEYKKTMGMRYTNSKRNENTSYWTYSTVHRILKNEMYVGSMVQSKTQRRMHGKPILLPEEKWIVVKDTHPAIISEELWSNVQNLLLRDTMQVDFNQNISVFAGFLKCGDCGRAMSKRHCGNDFYYNCGSYIRYGKTICSRHSISHRRLMEILLNTMNESIKKINDLQRIYEETKAETCKKTDLSDEVDKIKVLVSKLESKKLSLYDDYKEGLINKDEFLLLKSKYNKEHENYNNQIAFLEKNSQTSNENNTPKIIEKLIKFGQIEEKDIDRNFMATFIDRIEIFENNDIKIKLNFYIPKTPAN